MSEKSDLGVMMSFVQMSKISKFHTFAIFVFTTACAGGFLKIIAGEMRVSSGIDLIIYSAVVFGLTYMWNFILLGRSVGRVLSTKRTQLGTVLAEELCDIRDRYDIMFYLFVLIALLAAHEKKHINFNKINQLSKNHGKMITEYITNISKNLSCFVVIGSDTLNDIINDTYRLNRLVMGISFVESQHLKNYGVYPTDDFITDIIEIEKEFSKDANSLLINP